MSLFLAEFARTPRILTVGDVMVDRYINGDVTRISPEAPVPVLAAQRETMRAGGAANVAANVAALGGTSRLLGVAGRDPGRHDLDSMMEAAGVATDLIADDTGRTTEKIRLVSGSQQIARFDRDGTVGPSALVALRDRFETLAGEADLILFSDYNKGTLAGLPDLLAIARSLGRPSLVDPKRVDPERYRGAYLLKPNAAEFRSLFGPFDEAGLVEHARSVLRRYEIEHLVLTRGARGMLLVSADGPAIERPTEALEVYDVSGAGDTVLAALAVALGGGVALERAVELSNVAAGIAVSHAGTYVVNTRDMDQRIAASRYDHSKVVDTDTLQPLLEGHRRQGARIVFTNGCFDILHPGHVRMLKAAKAEGDILVLGLNSDASVRRLKGATRPINAFPDRAEVLAGLTAVDYVTEFGEDTPLELIRAVAPDVLVKGGDYRAEEIVGYDDVTSRGGRVVTVTFHAGHSTTSIASRITRASKIHLSGA